MRAGAHQRDDGEMKRSLPAGRGNSAHAAFKRCNAFLEYSIGGVAEARVYVPCALDIKQRRCVIRVGEAKGGRLVNRRGSCTRRGIWLRTGV